MYQIVKNGETIAIVEKLHFIRLHENGSFVETDEDTAQGIAVNSTPYNFHWREAMEGVEESVTYSEVNGGEYIVQQQNATDTILLTMLEGKK